MRLKPVGSPLGWPKMRTPMATNMKMISATILIKENQYSSSPKIFTESILNTRMPQMTTSASSHCGTASSHDVY